MAELEQDLVVIIDSSQDGRLDKMAEAFAGKARVQLAYDTGQRIIFTDTASGEIAALGTALVTLRHFRDLQIAEGNDTVITVYFGGNGGQDDAAPPDALYRIWRPVSAGSGYLNNSEASELLKFAKGIKKKEEDIRPPNFLRDPRVFFMLPALSILCQGYLAAHALPEAVPSIKHALEHMGMPAFLEGGGDDVALLKRIIPLKRGETSSPDWWVKVLGKSKKSVEEQVASEMGVKSIDSSTTVKALLEVVYKEAAGQIQPSVVADAYCDIVGKLTGRPCQR